MTDKIKYILLYLLANAGGKEDLPDMEDDVLNQAMGRISIESASESLLETQEHSMIAQDEIICRLAEGIVTCCGPWQLPGWRCLRRGR